MIPLTLKEFGGQLPAWDDRYLPDNQASVAQNTFLYSGALIGWRQPKKLRDLDDSTAAYAYRIPTTTQGTASATLAFLNNAIEGDQISIGEYTYTFTATVTNAYDVLLGSTALESAQNLFLTINFGSQDSAITGNHSVQNTQIAANNPFLGFPFSITASTNAPGANTLVLVKVKPSGTQKLTALHFMPAGSSAGAKFTGMIYNNVNSVEAGGSSYVDQASDIAATGAEVIGCVSGTPVTSTLAVPITLTGGATYWIGFLLDTSVAFAQASDTTNAISVPVTYTDGPPNPLTGIGVSPLPISSGQPNYQIWGDMVAEAPIDPINTIGTNDFGTGSIPYISVDAPDFGTAYNNTPLGEITSSSRMTWVSNLSGLNIVSFLTGGLNQTLDASITGVSQWLEFADPFTDVVKSPVVDDSFQRYYFASPSQPPQYNTYQRIVDGDPPWLLGVPSPGNPPDISAANGGSAATIGFDTSSSTNAANFTPNQMFLVRVISTSAGNLTDINAAVVTLTGGGYINTGGSNFTGGNYEVTPAAIAQALAEGKIHYITLPWFSANPSSTTVPAGTAVLSGVLYTDNNGKPGSIIGIGSAGITSGTQPETISSAFVSPIPISANTPYWLGIIFSASGTIQLADDVGISGALITTTGSPPASNPAVTTGQQDWQIWGDIDNSSAILESRAYVYTYETEYGEEGPPSPPTLADGWSNGTWSITVYPPVSDELGVSRNITNVNLYRTITGSGGGTTFFHVSNFDVEQGTYVDTKTDNIVAENFTLPSTSWFPPPEGLEGIVDMPNGIIAGFKGNEIWFCEPYRPHAWPPGYVLTTEFPIVGLGVTGQAVVACTNSSPAIAVGTSPAVMSMIKMTFPEPCNSRGSIISTAGGVLYTSNNGLISVTQGGVANNISQSWITREKWTKYVPQIGLTAIPLMGTYFAFGTIGGDAFRGITLELNADTDSQGFGQWPQIGGHRLGLQQLTAPGNMRVTNVMLDPWSSAALLIQGGSVYYYDFQDQEPTIQTALWRSKKYQTSHKDSFAAMRVWFDIPPGGPQDPPTPQTFANPTFTTSIGLPYIGGMFGVVRVLADGKYVMERELRYSTEMMRIPDGFKASTWQWEYEGVVSVTVIKAATSAKELGLGQVEGRP